MFVCPRIHVSGAYFWADVEGRADPCGGEIFVHQVACNTEVPELHHTRRRQEDVLWFQVFKQMNQNTQQEISDKV